MSEPEFDLAKLRRLQRQCDSLAARRHAIAELLQDAQESARFAHGSLAAQFRQAQALGRCVGAEFDDVADWTDGQLKGEGLSVKTRDQWREALEAADAYRQELAAIDAQSAPLRRLVAACERLVPPDTLHMPGVLKGA